MDWMLYKTTQIDHGMLNFSKDSPLVTDSASSSISLIESVWIQLKLVRRYTEDQVSIPTYVTVFQFTIFIWSQSAQKLPHSSALKVLSLGSRRNMN